MEVILNQEHSADVKSFFERVPPDICAISLFSLYSIGILFIREKKHEGFLTFYHTVIERGGIDVITLPPMQYPRLILIADKFGLDFDDAYQYTA